MDPVIAFLAAMVLATALLHLGLQPFLSLVVSAVVLGLLGGLGEELPGYVTTGLGNVFSGLAVVILCGAVIAEYLRKTGAMNRIVADLLEVSRGRGMIASAVAGYLISVPVMCCITSYIILEPVAGSLGPPRRLRFMLAAASVISFVTVYPSPVVTAISDELGLASRQALFAGLPVSLLLVAIAYLFLKVIHIPELDASGNGETAAGMPAFSASTREAGRIAAWLPLSLPLVLILAGAFSDLRPLKMLGNPDLALLIGALIAVSLARRIDDNIMKDVVSAATRRSGVILLDLCGAGAFGYVASKMGLATSMHALMSGLPVLLAPFIIAAVLQLALGSRVVTAVIAAGIMKGYPLDPAVVMLMICAGALTFSYVTDPFFWLVSRTTGSSLRETVTGYTAPLCICGIVAFAAAATAVLIF